MQQRNAIEGTISELARAHRGFAKVELQNLFIGTACNINDGCGSWPRPTSILKSTFYSSETSSKGSKVFVGHSGLV
jgi:hypothetical protein